MLRERGVVLRTKIFIAICVLHPAVNKQSLKTSLFMFGIGRFLVSKSKGYVKRICFQAIMAALFVALDYMSLSIGNSIKVTFSALPIIITAIYYGPFYGMAVGLIGSLITQIIGYGLTATTVLWILPAGLRGLSMGLLFIVFGRRKSFWCLTTEIAVSSLLVTALNTAVNYIDSIIYGWYSYEIIFGMTFARIALSVATAIALSLIMVPITSGMDKVIKPR